MRGRWRLNLVWLLFLFAGAYACVRVFTEPEAELAHPPHLIAVRWYLTLSALSIALVLLTDILGRPALPGWLYSYRSRDFWPKLTHWPIILSKDSTPVKALMLHNMVALSSAFVAAFLAFMALGAGSPRLASEVLCVAALAFVVYIRLRSHFSWEKKYLSLADNEWPPAPLSKKDEFKTNLGVLEESGLFYLVLLQLFVIIQPELHRRWGNPAVIPLVLMGLLVALASALIVYESRVTAEFQRQKAAAGEDEVHEGEGTAKTIALPRPLRPPFLALIGFPAVAAIFALAAYFLGSPRVYVNLILGFSWLGVVYMSYRLRTRWVRLLFDSE